MAHLRPRHLITVLLKSLRYWPVVCLIGPRQVGKSTFLKKIPGFLYESFDDTGLSEIARQDPKEILKPPCIIDEAQKVPKVFDAIKLNVDNQKSPGKFILTGSVRFSNRTLIRESLTGRSKTLQMFPLTCSETLSLSFRNGWQANRLRKFQVALRVSRNQFLRYLERGGMPGIFSARNHNETNSYWNSLIDSYVYRDLLFAVTKNPKPNIALSILRSISEILALGEVPTFARIYRKVGGVRSSVERHLIGLEDMMIIRRISHWQSSSSKDLFLPFDTAFFLTLLKVESPSHDAAIRMACLFITLSNELNAQFQAADSSQDLQYAQSTKGEIIHFITLGKNNRPTFWKIVGEEVPHNYSLRFLEALKTKHQGEAQILSSINRYSSLNGIHVSPWESVI